jgi:hypothetical protein
MLHCQHTITILPYKLEGEFGWDKKYFSHKTETHYELLLETVLSCFTAEA